MVAMGVGDEDRRHRLVTHGIEQRTDVTRIVRPRVNDGNAPAANDVAERALEGEWTGIIGHDPAHAGHHFVHRVGLEVESLVERNVVGHSGLRACYDANSNSNFAATSLPARHLLYALLCRAFTRGQRG